jgi:hypothetical protein
MLSDRKLLGILSLLLLLPIGLAAFGGDRFRYPCQDPANWDKQICKLPDCDVTRTCPEHIFKGQRDPRLGMKDATVTQATTPADPTPDTKTKTPSKGPDCAK